MLLKWPFIYFSIILKQIFILLIDIDFSEEDEGLLQDISGNGNDGMIYNDYRIDYEEETRIPEKVETQMMPQLDKDGKQF